MRLVLFLCLFTVFGGIVIYAGSFDCVDEFAPSIYADKDGKELPYRLLMPEPLSRNRKYPLVLFLHGIGERGDDNRAQLKWAVKSFATEDNRRNFPCFVTEYPGVGYRFWIEAYSDPGPFDWLFQQHKRGKNPPDNGSARKTHATEEKNQKANTITARIPYSLMLDGKYSEKIGANNILTFHRVVYGLENSYIGVSWFKEDSPIKKSVGLTFRLFKSVFIDNILDHLSMLAQHEVFGHGARYREFGYSHNRFSLHPFFPYGDGHGWASTGQPEPGRKITLHERTAMNFGGSESNRILSNMLRYNWLRRGGIDYRESILYLLTSNDLRIYILRTKYGLRGEAGNDVLSYLRNINAFEGYPGENNYRLTVDDLAGHIWIDFFSPFQYYSLFTYFVTYLWEGKERSPFPMIDLLGMKYLPSFRLGLTPFGSEFYWENFLVQENKVFNIYFRYGDPTFHRFWGCGAEAVNLIQNRRYSLTTRVDVWHQPSLFLGGKVLKQTRGGWGGALMATLFFKIFKDNPLCSLVAQVGYKSSGYLEGEKLGRGFMVRAGLSFLEF
jgi:hypothetical protein